ncbi:aspartic proteinase Asp1 isoform X2 [Prunus yedoensis var. nudiflora]|uniref:Aspartic proteinase Asp1 isoform X2 n=1 Tax=Prunus yedoensis var. nudiflora TaxID=2094558 RepID=A0A314UQ26_PRUYE|nr:aspartic proteinase Asp1 isoform X2 [Prunus yedoensis var. nudiflora]
MALGGDGGRRNTTALIVRVSASFLFCFSAANQPCTNRKSSSPLVHLASSAVFPLQGNVYPLGYYSLSLNIGRPAKIFELDIDSGSDLTQVQCDAPCTGCTKMTNVTMRSNMLIMDHLFGGAGQGILSPEIHQWLSPQSPFGLWVGIPSGVDMIRSILVWSHLPLPESLAWKWYTSGPAELVFGGKATSVKGLNMIFDSGSSYTYFNSQAYQAIVTLKHGNVCLGILNGTEVGLGNLNIIGELSRWQMKHYSSGPAELAFGSKPTSVKGLHMMVVNDLNGKPLKDATEDQSSQSIGKAANRSNLFPMQRTNSRPCIELYKHQE